MKEGSETKETDSLEENKNQQKVQWKKKDDDVWFAEGYNEEHSRDGTASQMGDVRFNL